MYVSRAHFSDFRGFEENVAVTLPEELAILAGPNGCGKTSVLVAIASCLSGFPQLLAGVNRTLFAGGDPTNIRMGAESATWGIEVRERLPDSVFLSLGAWHKAVPKDRVIRGATNFGFPSDWAKSLASGESPTLPVLAWLHGGTTRMPVALDEQSGTGRLAAYHGAFDEDALHFEAFQQWFVEEENLENEQRVRKKSLGHQLPTLRAVRSALTTFFGDLGDVPLSGFRASRSHVGGPLGETIGRLTTLRQGTELFVDQLSDGERRLLVLVGDLARRMAILNPHLEAPTEGPGVLLVDEIDLHLHPAWQRRVVPALRATFPKVQLLATTHSPQVLASVPSKSIVLMRDFRFLPGHPATQGRDTNTLLETVFDVPSRPAETAAELREVYRALDENPKRARTLYRKLKKSLESTDPELTRIETLLDLVGG